MKKCSVEGCGGEVRSKGLCNKHYQRVIAHGTVDKLPTASRFIDLTGQKFGRLTVLERKGNTSGGNAQWLCACDCGGQTIATTSILRSRHKLSCGCAYKFDLTGNRFGMLKVIGEFPEEAKGRKRVHWICKCDCGNTTRTTTAALVNGHSTSCGCVRTKHMGKGTRLYNTYYGMRDRCHNPKSKYYSRYGAKGIFVCDEWMESFTAFRMWALSTGYTHEMTIDRIKNEGPYSPDNCQWLTREENAKKSDKPCNYDPIKPNLQLSLIV